LPDALSQNDWFGVRASVEQSHLKLPTLTRRRASHTLPTASQQQLMRAAFLLVTFVSLATFSASCGGGGIEHVSTLVTPLGVSLSALGVNFGSLSTGSSSSPQSITLTNTGGGVVTISGVAVSGEFTETNNCGTSVAIGSSCTINVIFAPTSSGTRSGTLSISDNAPGSPQMVTLSGTGVEEPAVSLAPASVTFSSQTVGTASGSQSVTLTNRGNATLAIAGITASGDFTQTNNCGRSVAIGSSCTITVIFDPTGSGTRSGTLRILDNAPGSPQMVSLSGTGAPAEPAVSVAPASVTFPGQPVGTSSTPQRITLANTGNATLSIASLAVAGTNANDFAQTNTCNSSVGAGANCTISITFTPSAAGSGAASLMVADNAAGSPQMVNLSGNGIGPAVGLSPASLTFGSQAVGTTSTPQTTTLTNTGTASLIITSLAVIGTNASEFTETDACGSSVTAGAYCMIAVTFTPSAFGAATATLLIADNASGSPQTVSLFGTASHDVILSWTASATPDITGYYVFRGMNSGGESSTPLNSTPIIGTSYVD
jgi:hypothetical protein